MRGILGIVSLAVLASCQQPAELRADGAWVRLPAVAGNPGAAYFTIHGGDKADTLLAVTTRAALRTEMHQSMKDDHGMMAMEPIREVAIASRAVVAFAPGGQHVMLYDIGPNVHAGERIPIALDFASGRRMEIQAMVVAPGGSAPKDEGK